MLIPNNILGRLGSVVLDAAISNSSRINVWSHAVINTSYAKLTIEQDNLSQGCNFERLQGSVIS